MIITGSISKVRSVVNKAFVKGKIIGLVPTMGCLHEGHLSLIRAAVKECGFVCVSVFVNPLQFGPKEDYNKYPRVFIRDKRALLKEKVNLLFHPSYKMMYPKGFSVFVEENDLSRGLCGEVRPGHFRGVCTVVAKLFNITRPSVAYFGEKDYQQAMVIKRMARDFNFPVKIKIFPIVREDNGLAMSSRNSYLSASGRKKASVLYRALTAARGRVKEGERDVQKVIAPAREAILSLPDAKIDYIKIVDTKDLRELNIIDREALIAAAVYIGKVRLIDNITVKIKGVKR